MHRRFIGFLALKQKFIILLLLVFAIVLPFTIKNQYIFRLAILSLQWIFLTQSLNLLAGVLGQISLGHIAFYGIGAYTCTILAKNYDFPTWAAWLAAIAVSALFGFALALPTLRLSGYYLTIVTLGFGEIIRLIEINWVSLTRGPLGILNIPKPEFFGYQIKSNIQFYFLMLIILVLSTVLLCRLVNSRTGRAIVATREDSIAAEAMGINIFKYKTMVFVIAAAMAGLCGAFFAQYTNYIDPTSFKSDQSTLLIIMALLGGMGSQIGPFIGAIVLTILPEMIRELMEYRMLLYGVVLLLIMQVRPDGLMGGVNLRYVRQKLLFEKERSKKTAEKGAEAEL